MASGLYIAPSASESEALNALTQASTTALGRMQHRAIRRSMGCSLASLHARSQCAQIASMSTVGIAGSGPWAWLRSPELDQVGVGVQEVGADALGRVHVPGLLR